MRSAVYTSVAVSYSQNYVLYTGMYHYVLYNVYSVMHTHRCVIHTVYIPCIYRVTEVGLGAEAEKWSRKIPVKMDI